MQEIIKISAVEIITLCVLKQCMIMEIYEKKGLSTSHLSENDFCFYKIMRTFSIPEVTVTKDHNLLSSGDLLTSEITLSCKYL